MKPSFCLRTVVLIVFRYNAVSRASCSWTKTPTSKCCRVCDVWAGKPSQIRLSLWISDVAYLKWALYWSIESEIFRAARPRYWVSSQRIWLIRKNGTNHSRYFSYKKVIWAKKVFREILKFTVIKSMTYCFYPGHNKRGSIYIVSGVYYWHECNVFDRWWLLQLWMIYASLYFDETLNHLISYDSFSS